jgi:hypothetical protein
MCVSVRLRVTQQISVKFYMSGFTLKFDIDALQFRLQMNNNMAHLVRSIRIYMRSQNAIC